MSENSPSPSAPPRYTPTQRRLLTAAAGLGVVALAGGSFVLSYDDLRALALQGGASKRFAPLYPFMIDGLVTVTILALVVARQAHWWSRWIRWALLSVLIAGAASASAERAIQGYGSLPHRWLSAGVAIAPWAILLVAVWLWLAMFKHVRAALAHPSPATAPPHPEPDHSGALIPGLEDEPETAAPVPAPAEPKPPTATKPKPEPQPVVAKEAAKPASPPTEPATRVEPKTEPAVPATLPTDVKLVGRPAEQPKLKDTQPEGLPVRPPEAVGAEEEPDESDVDRAEDPDAGEDEPTGPAARFENEPADSDVSSEHAAVERWSAEAAEEAKRWADDAAHRFGSSGSADEQTTTVEWTPPASKFRSSPTPPRD